MLLIDTSAAYFSIDASLKKKKKWFYVKLFFYALVHSKKYQIPCRCFVVVVYGSVSFYFNLQICILITGLLAGDASLQLSKLPTWVKKVHFSWLKLSRGVCLWGVLCFILLSHQGILRRMHCSLFLEESSIIFFFLEKNNSESKVGIIRMNSSVGRHRGEEWKRTFVTCLSQ